MLILKLLKKLLGILLQSVGNDAKKNWELRWLGLFKLKELIKQNKLGGILIGILLFKYLKFGEDFILYLIVGYMASPDHQIKFFGNRKCYRM